MEDRQRITWPVSPPIMLAAAILAATIGLVLIWRSDDAQRPPHEFEEQIAATEDGDERPVSQPRPQNVDAPELATSTTTASSGEQENEASALGPRRWMAEADDVDLDDLEEQLDEGATQQAFELSMRRDRRRSIERAEQVVQSCMDELLSRQRQAPPWRPESSGRLAIQWEMSTSGGMGVIEKPEILHQLGPRDEPFESCIERSLQGLEFDAVGDGAQMTVRWIYASD